jgi:hypothetical protein
MTAHVKRAPRVERSACIAKILVAPLAAQMVVFLLAQRHIGILSDLEGAVAPRRQMVVGSHADVPLPDKSVAGHFEVRTFLLAGQLLATCDNVAQRPTNMNIASIQPTAP